MLSKALGQESIDILKKMEKLLRNDFSEIESLPDTFSEYVEFRYQYYSDVPLFDTYYKYDGQYIGKSTQDKFVALLFNGNIVSTASAIMYKELGYEVLLLTYCSPHTFDNLTQLADRLGCSINHIRRMQGVKPVMPLSLGLCHVAMSHLLNHDLPINLAVGTYDNNSIYSKWGADDISKCRETYDTYAKALSCIIEDFRIRRIIPQQSIAWEKMIEHIGILDDLQLSAEHSALRDIVEMDYNKLEYDSTIYKNKFNILKKSNRRYNGEMLSDKEFWKLYMFYPIYKSKLFSDSF